MQDSGHISEWQGERVQRTRANGKRIFSPAFKAWLVEQASRPGVSVAALAIRHEINANQLRRWMRLAQPARMPSIVPVTVLPCAPVAASAVASLPPPPPIEIELAGALVRVHRGADAQHLRLVLQALRP